MNKSIFNILKPVVCLLTAGAIILSGSPAFAAKTAEAQSVLKPGAAAESVNSGSGDSEKAPLSYLDSGFYLEDYPEDSIVENAAEHSLPASFLPDLTSLPAPRNQNIWGMCWSFATIGAVEISAVKAGLCTAAEIDLSELAHGWYYYDGNGQQYDPLGNITFDKNQNISYQREYGHPDQYIKTFLDNGGIAESDMWNLAAWIGPIDEAICPYTSVISFSDAIYDILDECMEKYGTLDPETYEWYFSGESPYGSWSKASKEACDKLDDYLTKEGFVPVSGDAAFSEDSYHIQDIEMIPLSEDCYPEENPYGYRDDIKEAILEHGSALIGYWEDPYATSSESQDTFYNAEYNSLYNPTDYSTNHAVLIVGWNDSFPKENFNSVDGNKPANDGAWLIRNSWYGYNTTDNYSHSRYFWISYEDASLNKDMSYPKSQRILRYALVYGVENADNYSNNYQYDGTGCESTITVKKNMKAANVYEVKGNPGGYETLDAVSFGTLTNGGEYRIDVYTGLGDPASDGFTPNSGTLADSVTKTDAKCAGYYTVKLTHSILIPEGSFFSVVITPTNKDAEICVEEKDDCYSRIYIDADISQRQSFVKTGTGLITLTWQDLWNESGTDAKCARIKGFTTNLNASAEPQLYTGEDLTPEITVTKGETELVRDTDYTLSYENNREPGTAKVTVTGIKDSANGFEGKFNLTFEITEDAAEYANMKIDAIGTAEFTAECRARIDAARTAYNALDSSEKERVPEERLEALTAAEEAYSRLFERAAENAAAVVSKINSIGTAEYTEDCKTRIDAARTSFDALNTETAELVPGETIELLTAAEAEYARLKSLADDAAVENAVNKINAIGDISGTPSPECLERIEAAHTAYAALSEEQKLRIPESCITVNNKAFPKLADAKINAIGGLENVNPSEECHNKIMDARNFCISLSERQLDCVESYDLLDSKDGIESKYAGFIAGYMEEANSAEKDGAWKSKIDKARSSFDSLTWDEQFWFLNKYHAIPEYKAAYERFLITEEAYQNWDCCTVSFDAQGGQWQEGAPAPQAVTKGSGKVTKPAEPDAPPLENHEFAGWYTEKECVNPWSFETDSPSADMTLFAKWRDMTAVNSCLDAINSIGEVTFGKECKALIDAARAAYDALTAEEKAFVPETAVLALTGAEAKYAILKTAAEFPFTDMDGHWAKDAVRYVSYYKLMNGTGSGKFSPDVPLTRAMMVTILYRLEKEPTVPAGTPFEDVEDGCWYTKAIAWASKQNLVNGYGNGSFGPGDSITREQMAKILFAYTKYKGFDSTATKDLKEYTDASDVSGWAKDAVRWANAAGLITGRTKSTIVPKGKATRAEAATVLTRYIKSAAESSL